MRKVLLLAVLGGLCSVTSQEDEDPGVAGAGGEDPGDNPVGGSEEVSAEIEEDADLAPGDLQSDLSPVYWEYCLDLDEEVEAEMNIYVNATISGCYTRSGGDGLSTVWSRSRSNYYKCERGIQSIRVMEFDPDCYGLDPEEDDMPEDCEPEPYWCIVHRSGEPMECVGSDEFGATSSASCCNYHNEECKWRSKNVAEACPEPPCTKAAGKAMHPPDNPELWVHPKGAEFGECTLFADLVDDEPPEITSELFNATEDFFKTEEDCGNTAKWTALYFPGGITAVDGNNDPHWGCDLCLAGNAYGGAFVVSMGAFIIWGAIAFCCASEQCSADEETIRRKDLTGCKNPCCAHCAVFLVVFVIACITIPIGGICINVHARGLCGCAGEGCAAPIHEPGVFVVICLCVLIGFILLGYLLGKYWCRKRFHIDPDAQDDSADKPLTETEMANVGNSLDASGPANVHVHSTGYQQPAQMRNDGRLNYLDAIGEGAEDEKSHEHLIHDQQGKRTLTTPQYRSTDQRADRSNLTEHNVSFLDQKAAARVKPVRMSHMAQSAQRPTNSASLRNTRDTTNTRTGRSNMASDARSGLLTPQFRPTSTTTNHAQANPQLAQQRANEQRGITNTQMESVMHRLQANNQAGVQQQPQAGAQPDINALMARMAMLEQQNRLLSAQGGISPGQRSSATVTSDRLLPQTAQHMPAQMNLQAGSQMSAGAADARNRLLQQAAALQQSGFTENVQYDPEELSQREMSYGDGIITMDGPEQSYGPGPGPASPQTPSHGGGHLAMNTPKVQQGNWGGVDRDFSKSQGAYGMNAEDIQIDA